MIFMFIRIEEMKFLTNGTVIKGDIIIIIKEIGTHSRIKNFNKLDFFAPLNI